MKNIKAFNGHISEINLILSKNHYANREVLSKKKDFKVDNGLLNIVQNKYGKITNEQVSGVGREISRKRQNDSEGQRWLWTFPCFD